MRIGRAKGALFAALLVGLVAGCGDDPAAPEFEVIEDIVFDPSLMIDLAQYTMLPSGVYTLDVTVGTGNAIAAGDFATVDHTGWFRDGVAFSSGQFTYQFAAIPRQVIPGFQNGMAGMLEGGKRRIIIPPEEAYGASPPAGIPVGAVLVFEVDLLSLS